jgi:hypothetical protein
VKIEAENYSSRVYGTPGTILTIRQFDQVNAANLGLELSFTVLIPDKQLLEEGHSELDGLNGASKAFFVGLILFPQTMIIWMLRLYLIM